MDFAYILVIAFAVFLVVFVRTELGLYLVIFSMLLSPKLGSGSGELAEGRRVVIRTEDLVLIVGAAFLTAAIVSVIGAAQIPTGRRVSAPFEGSEGEPNTFGGYLLFMMALAGGIALETKRLRVRLTCLALLALMALPFAYTLSRASFLAVPFVLAALGVFSPRRRVVVGALLLLLVAAPLIGVALLPKPGVHRILCTI